MTDLGRVSEETKGNPFPVELESEINRKEQ